MKNELIYKKLIEIEKLIHLSNDEIMDIEGADKFLKTSKSIIYQYVFKREIPHFKPNKRLYFSKLDLLEWVKEKRVKTVEELEREMDPFYNHRFPWLRSNQ